MALGFRSIHRLPPLVAVALFLTLPSPTAPQQITAEDVAARCAEAMGGESGANAIRSLRFLLRLPDSTQNIHWEIQRPNKVRKERPGQMVLVFDGHRAGFLEGPPQEDGTLQGPHLVPAEDWHHFEMDVALFVPAFFDYPAEYLGTEVENGSTLHLLGVQLPMGGEARYAVDGETFLPVKVMLPGWGLERRLGDYREVDGITYFHAFWSDPDREDLTLLDGLVIDENRPGDRFALPPDIGR